VIPTKRNVAEWRTDTFTIFAFSTYVFAGFCGFSFTRAVAGVACLVGSEFMCSYGQKLGIRATLAEKHCQQRRNDWADISQQADPSNRPKGAKIGILGSSDHFQGLLKELADVSFLLRYRSVDDALTAIGAIKPDFLLLTPLGPGCNTACAISAVKSKSPHLPVIVISAKPDSAEIFACVTAGVDGYLLHPVSAYQLFRASLESLEHHVTLCSHSTTLLAKYLRSPVRRNWATILTPKEREIAALLIQRCHNKDIANTCHIAGNTVHAHLENIYRKLNARNRQEAIQALLQQNTLPGDTTKIVIKRATPI
jgi:DNA-binding NarL/FixJ family response regulator